MISKQERLIIIFLVSTAITGLGISFYQKTHQSKITVSHTSFNNKVFSDRLININTASDNELSLLPGIGPALAKDISDYRQEKGFFYSTEEITKVPGIGKSKYEKIKNLITIENE